MSVGSVFYDVVPDLDGFSAKVAAGLSGVKPVKIKVEADTTSQAKATAGAQKAATQQTAIASRAAAQQNAIASRAAAQQAAIRERGAQQQQLLAQRTAAQQAAAQARVAAAADRAAQRQTAVQAKMAAAQDKASSRKTAVADNLGKIEAAGNATNKLTTAEARLASAQGTSRLAAVRLAEAQADGAAGSTRLLASQEAYARSLRSVSLAEQAAAASAAKNQAKGSFTGKVNTSEVQAVGRSFAVAGAAIGVGVGLAVRASANFEQAMSGVASTGHYTQGQLELLSKAAVAGGQATQYSATEAAQGEAELVKAGLSVQQVLGGGLTGALNLAAAGNLSVADSASAVATAVNQFALNGNDAIHVADRFVQVAGVAQGETSDVAEAFKNGAVTAHQYGLSIDDASVVTAAFAKNGLVGAQAGTLLKSSLTNLYAPTGRVKEALDQLGISAYDAAGNAKPVADVAEQLHARLAPLSEDARNNALARIFGKETLQGGAILAQEGAAGLKSIRDQLDQFPTAAQTAATKMDNLKGDVEQLSGSLETGLIKSGSGANGFLRDLTKSATAAVNGFTDLPGAVQKSALVVGTVASAGLLATGGLVKLVGGAAQAKVALDTLSSSGSKVPGVLGGIGKVAGVVALAIAAIGAAGAASDHFFGTAPTTLGEAGQAITELGSAASGATPLTDDFFSVVNNQGAGPGFFSAVKNVNGLGDAFAYLAKDKGATGVFDSITSKIPGITSTSEKINTRFTQLDGILTSLGSTSAPQAAASFDAIRKVATEQGVSLDDLVAKFPEYKQQLADQATALGVTVPDSAQVYADWMGGKVPDAVLEFAKVHPQATGASALLAKQQDKTTASFATAKTALKNLIDPQKLSGDAAQALSTKLFGTAQAALSASQAQIAYGQAVRQAKASTGGGIDPKTEKGASNLSLLNQQASAYQAVASAQIAAGKSAGSVAAGTADARKAFIDNAEAMGVSSGKAKDLADKYGLIPKNVKVKIEEEVQKNAEDELTKLKSLDGTVITPKVQALIDQGKYKQALSAVKDLQKSRTARVKADADTAGAKKKIEDAAKSRQAKLKAQAEGIAKANGDLNKAARSRQAQVKVYSVGVGTVQGAINGIHGKTVNIKVVTTKSTRVADNDKANGGTLRIPGRLAGGTVPGKGGPRDDDVYGIDRATGAVGVMVSSGEEIIRVSQASRNRPALKKINAGGDWDVVPRRANGGSVPSVHGDSAAAKAQTKTDRHRPIVINVDLGPDLGGIRRIVAEEIDASGEYSATVSRMRKR